MILIPIHSMVNILKQYADAKNISVDLRSEPGIIEAFARYNEDAKIQN